MVLDHKEVRRANLTSTVPPFLLWITKNSGVLGLQRLFPIVTCTSHGFAYIKRVHGAQMSRFATKLLFFAYHNEPETTILDHFRVWRANRSSTVPHFCGGHKGLLCV